MSGYGTNPPYELGSDELRVHVRDMVTLATLPKRPWPYSVVDAQQALAAVQKELDRRRIADDPRTPEQRLGLHMHTPDEPHTEHCDPRRG